MLFEKIFSGGNSSKDMHSNQYAVGTTSTRTFSQRKRIEQKRSRIASYRHSKLGYGVVPRDEYEKVQSGAVDAKDQSSIQATQPIRPAQPERLASPPPQRTFREPPGRNFNPYA